MHRLARDVEQMARRRGRNPCITYFERVVSVREHSPHACFSPRRRSRENGRPFANQVVRRPPDEEI